MPELSKAAQDVLAERERQIAKGWTPEHDDGHDDGWIAEGASEMLMRGQHAMPGSWAWEHKHPDSPERLARRGQLVVGAAMALAEIERIDRAVACGRDPFPPLPAPPTDEEIVNARRHVYGRRW